MPLQASNFVMNGPIQSSDMLQFFNLLTGAMIDQPVTLSNTVSVGGDQQRDLPGLRVYGGIDLYTSRQDDVPGFGITPSGFSWGDTVFQSAPAGGIVVAPQLTVAGDLAVTGTISGTLAGLDALISAFVVQLRPGVTAFQGVAIGGADPWSSGITTAPLVVRSADLGPNRLSVVLASFECWSGNWLQFNVRVHDTDASQGWQSKKLTLDFDTDGQTPGTAGRITLQNGKVGIGSISDVEGAILALQEKVG